MNPVDVPVPGPAAGARPGLLRRHLGIYAALWRHSVVRDMQFKLNFVLWIAVEFLWFAMQLAFMSVLYSHTESIAGWSRWEVVFLVGCSHFIQQVFTALFFSNLNDISEHIRTGRLDFLLLLPVNTRFVVSLRRVDLGAFVNAASALVVMGWALHRLGVTPGPGRLAAFALLCAAGVLVHYSLMFLFTTVAFWTVRAQGIVWGYYNLFNLARIPEGAVPQGMFRRVFTWVLPMLLVANVPSQVMLGTLDSPVRLLAMIGVALACLGVSEVAWRFSLRHYTSASS